MWTYEPHDEYLKRARDFRKRWRREHDAVLDNLDQYRLALEAGAHPLKVPLGFIHAEGMGAIALDERGHGKGRLKATRLYLYPDSETCQIHILTIGDKSSQPNDVKTCHQFIESCRRNASRD